MKLFRFIKGNFSAGTLLELSTHRIALCVQSLCAVSPVSGRHLTQTTKLGGNPPTGLDRRSVKLAECLLWRTAYDKGNLWVIDYDRGLWQGSMTRAYERSLWQLSMIEDYEMILSNWQYQFLSRRSQFFEFTVCVRNKFATCHGSFASRRPCSMESFG